MKIKSLLAVAVLAATGVQASAFEWKPVSLYPNPSIDITSTYFLANVSFNCKVDGVEKTDVMPVWIDEDGNEIKPFSAEQNPWGFDPTAFVYLFNEAAFKSNGEYTLLFPEGMLVNAAGEKSDKVETLYSVDIPELAPGMFEDFEVISITPELSQPQAIWSDQVITINTNHNDAIGLTTLRITDTTTEEVICTSSNFTTGRVPGDSSSISWEVVGSFKFYEDHKYVADFIFYNGKDEVTEDGQPTQIVDRASFEFTGRVESYKYSSVELLSVEPAPGSVLISEPSQAVFTFTFSGPVSVYKAVTPLGQNGQVDYPESCFSSNEDNTVWTLNLSDNNYVKSVDAILTVCIYVRDTDGNQLLGTFGEETQSRFEFDWDCELGGFPIEIVSPTAGETIDRLSEIVVKSVSGEAMAWSWTGEAYVTNQLGEILGTLVCDEGNGETDAALNEIHFSKWMDENWTVTPIDLVKEGYYAVQFGPGCFLMGNQYDSKKSCSVTSTFIISGVLDTPDDPVDPSEQEVFIYDRVSPESGSTVASLNLINLWYPDQIDTMGKDAVVYNKTDQSIVTYAMVLYDWDDLYMVNVEFEDEVVEAGEYEVVIPSRAICTSEFFASDGEKGICNPEIKLSYTVDPNADAVETVAAAAHADVFDIHGRLVLRDASAADMKSLSKGIYIVAGRKLVIK